MADPRYLGLYPVSGDEKEAQVKKKSIVEENAPFAEAVKEYIKRRGFKQRYVAEQAGYSTQKFCDFLTGRSLIKAQDIKNIVEVLDMDLNEVFKKDKGVKS